MIKARVEIRDLMTLRAAALQVHARRGAQFAPAPEVISASPPPRPAKTGAGPAEVAPTGPAASTPVAPTPEDAPGAWMDADVGLPDDLLDHLAGQDGWAAEHAPDPQGLPPRTESRAAPTRPGTPAPDAESEPPPAVPASAAPSRATPEEDAFSLPDFTGAPPEDAAAGEQRALSQLLREQLKIGAERGRTRGARTPEQTSAPE